MLNVGDDVFLFPTMKSLDKQIQCLCGFAAFEVKKYDKIFGVLVFLST